MRAVNLLTPDLRSAPKGKGSARANMDAPGGIAAFVLLGALALCVAGVAGSVLSNNVVKERKADLAAVKAQNAAAVTKAAALKPYADFQTVAEERSGTVQALASARFAGGNRIAFDRAHGLVRLEGRGADEEGASQSL